MDKFDTLLTECYNALCKVVWPSRAATLTTRAATSWRTAGTPAARVLHTHIITPAPMTTFHITHKGEDYITVTELDDDGTQTEHEITGAAMYVVTQLVTQLKNK